MRVGDIQLTNPYVAGSGHLRTQPLDEALLCLEIAPTQVTVYDRASYGGAHQLATTFTINSCGGGYIGLGSVLSGTDRNYAAGDLVHLSASVLNVPGAGTVTSVSVAMANGISGTVATPTTTPAITLVLGAITPTTIVASSTIAGSNLSGTNTGDQTFASLSPLSTLGDTLYFSTVNARLAGNITTTRKFYSQLGVGASSAAPIWLQPDFTDLTGSATAAQLPTVGLVISQHAGAVTVDVPSAGAVTSDLSVTDAHSITMAVSTVVTLTNPASSKRQGAILYLIQPGGGSCVPTFSPSVNWGAAGTPAWSTAGNKVDIVVLDWNGTNYRGSVFGLGF
jgi:hypothetical protein